jgi:hypothetical protein
MRQQEDDARADQECAEHAADRQGGAAPRVLVDRSVVATDSISRFG